MKQGQSNEGKMENKLSLIVEQATELSGKTLSQVQLDLVEIASHLLANICVQVRIKPEQEPEPLDESKQRFELGQPVEVAIYNPNAKAELIGWQRCRVIDLVESPVAGGGFIYLYKTTIGSYSGLRIRAVED